MAIGYGRKWGYSYGLADPVTLLVPRDQILPYADESESFNPIPAPVGPFELYQPMEFGAGDLTDTQPIEELTVTATGARAFSFYDDFYERLYYSPNPVDFGIISDQTSVGVTIWNAFPTTSSIIAIDDSQLEYPQVDLAGYSLPVLIAGLEEYTFNFTANISGPSSIATSATFTASTGQVDVIEIVGTRGKLWPFLPNWSRSVEEVIEYKTEIITSRSGREQRIALRETPRKSVSYSAAVHANTRRQMNAHLDKYHHVDQVLADYPRYTRATAAVPSDTSSFTVEDVPSWLEPGALVVVTNTSETSLRYVEAVNAVTKTINFRNTGTAFNSGARICLGLVGHLQETLTTRLLTNDVAEVAIRFDVAPTYEPYVEPPAATEVAYGREVLTIKPDWVEPITLEYERLTEVVDYGRGKIARFNPVGFGSHVNRMLFTNKDYETTQALVNVFRRARGQRGEFYVPSWANDIQIISESPAGAVTLNAAGTDLADSYFDHPVFKAICVVKTDGTRIYRKIVTIFEDVVGGDPATTIQVDSPWPSALNPSNVAMICWMPCTRFASDAITIEWLTDEVSRIQLATRTVEDLPAET